MDSRMLQPINALAWISYNRKIEGLAEYYYSGRDEGKQKAPSEYALDFIQMTELLIRRICLQRFLYLHRPISKRISRRNKEGCSR